MDQYGGSCVIVKSRDISTKLLRVLNSLVVDEFNAIHHYMVHSAICGGWGYTLLEDKFKEESLEELGHAKALMDRIAVFDKVPTLNQFPAVERPTDVKSMIEKQIELEKGALDSYNKAVELFREAGDNGTKDILNHNLMDEERHWDWLKEQRDKISQMGIENYLLLQVGEEEAEKAMGSASAAPLGVQSLDENEKVTLEGNAPRSSGGPAFAGGKALSGAGAILPLNARNSSPLPAPVAGPSSVSKSISVSLPGGIKPSLRPLNRKK